MPQKDLCMPKICHTNLPLMAMLYKQEGSPYWWLGWNIRGKRFRASTKVHHNGAKNPPPNGIAMEILRKKQEEIARLAFGMEMPAANDTLIVDWVNDYLKWYRSRDEISQTTLRSVVYTVQVFERWCKEQKLVVLNQITPDIALRHVRSKASSSKTQKNQCGILAKMWQEAKDRKLTHFDNNPWSAASPKKVMSESRRPLTDEEVNILLKETSGWKQYAVYMGAYTGERLGAILCLSVDCVDFEKRVIRFPASILKQKKDRFVFTPPALADFLKTFKPHGETWAEPKIAENNRKNGKASEHMSDVFKSLHQKYPHLFEKATFHCLRHTFASKLANAGVPEAIRKEIVGHSTSVSHALYVHESEKKALALAEYVKGVSY